jgi:hypothetical protein
MGKNPPAFAAEGPSPSLTPFTGAWGHSLPPSMALNPRTEAEAGSSMSKIDGGHDDYSFHILSILSYIRHQRTIDRTASYSPWAQ